MSCSPKSPSAGTKGRWSSLPVVFGIAPFPETADDERLVRELPPALPEFGTRLATLDAPVRMLVAALSLAIFAVAVACACSAPAVCCMAGLSAALRASCLICS